MLSGSAEDTAAAVIFNGDDIPDDVLAGCIREQMQLNGHCIEADIFTYGGHTLAIARPAAPLQDRFSANMRIRRSVGNNHGF